MIAVASIDLVHLLPPTTYRPPFAGSHSTRDTLARRLPGYFHLLLGWGSHSHDQDLHGAWSKEHHVAHIRTWRERGNTTDWLTKPNSWCFGPSATPQSCFALASPATSLLLLAEWPRADFQTAVPFPRQIDDQRPRFVLGFHIWGVVRNVSA